MIALSVKQPWASLIARGRKTIETRTWNTSYRGQLGLFKVETPEEFWGSSALTQNQPQGE